MTASEVDTAPVTDPRPAPEVSLGKVLAGRRAIVTGASGGIGREIAAALAGAGASVGLLARRSEELAETAELISGHDTQIAWRSCDVTETDQVTDCVAALVAELGPVTVLVNNAGGARFSAPLLQVQRHGWDKVMALNLTAPYLLGQALVPGMIAAGGGSIVNVGSLVSLKAPQSLAPYASAKAGLTMLTRSMAREWGPHKVRANAVIPGLVATDAWEHYRSDPDLDDLMDGDIALGRWATPAEIATPVVFLASEAASYITGAALVIDGGATA